MRHESSRAEARRAAGGCQQQLRTAGGMGARDLRSRAGPIRVPARRAWGLGAPTLLVRAAFSLPQRCVAAGASAEGAILYAEGKQAQGKEKLSTGLSANMTKVAELKDFADGLETVGRIPGADQYVAALQPAIELVKQAAARAEQAAATRTEPDAAETEATDSNAKVTARPPVRRSARARLCATLVQIPQSGRSGRLAEHDRGTSRRRNPSGPTPRSQPRADSSSSLAASGYSPACIQDSTRWCVFVRQERRCGHGHRRLQRLPVRCRRRWRY